MFNNLRELIISMPDEKTCREYLAKQRWADGKAVCPYCGHGKCYSIEDGERYKCASNKCYKRFRITVGTIMEASNIPLVKWFTAIYLVTAHKKGISSYQLGKDIGTSQKTAWFMLHRIREMLKGSLSRRLDNTVEADETYVGGSIKNKHISVRKQYAETRNWLQNKTTVLALIERNGEAMAKVIESNSIGEVDKEVRANIVEGATVVTDAHSYYVSLSDTYSHHTVNHTANEFIKGNFHTNNIEGMFSHFKRMVYGIYHQISPKHTQRYLDEFLHRYNNRKMKDADRFTLSFNNVERRLTYKNLITVKETPVKKVQEVKHCFHNNCKPVYQLKDGEVIGSFPSVQEASRVTGIDWRNIHKVVKGKRSNAGGFVWVYA